MDNPDQPERSDHRRLGRELGIFATDEMVGAGLPLWLPAGAAVRAALERYIVEEERRAGYQHVYTPELAKRDLYERSGHWTHFRDDMYPPMRTGAEEVVLRPMNCPHHVLVFAHRPRTARELPVRLAELGTMFRHERSGVVGGLSRVRCMTLNDGHVFCPPDAIGEEIAAILALVSRAYGALGLPEPGYRLSLRDQGSKYVADDEMWARGEAMLRAALDGAGLGYDEARGEAAFYGPKIDLQVSDPQGREETLSTIQVDFHLPRRFGLVYQDGPVERVPVMVHRSIVSTMERMVAHLLEVHDGALPFWLAPVQVAILPVVDDARSYAVRLRELLHDEGIRVELDDRNATLAARVRDAEMRRAPAILVVGRREMEAATVSLRRRSGATESLPLAGFVSLAVERDRARALTT